MARSHEQLDARYAARYPAEGPLPPREVAAQDAALAREALVAGNLEAVYHALAGALLVDPTERTWIASLERALARDASHLEEHDGCEPWSGFVAVRAYASWHRGDLADALVGLEQLPSRDASRFAEAWGLPWLSAEGALEKVDVGRVVRYLRRIGEGYADPPVRDPSAPRVLGAALDVLARAEARSGASDAIAVVRGMMLARAGRIDEALAVTAREAERRPTTMTLTAAAMARRRGGDWEGAIAWFRRAADLEPAYPGCLLDIGDLYVEHEREAEALEAYEEALRRQPGQDWAEPSALYCRYRTTGARAALDALRTMAHGARCTCGGAGALAALRGGYSYDDRQSRAEYLMRRIEPGFVPRPVEIVH